MRHVICPLLESITAICSFNHTFAIKVRSLMSRLIWNTLNLAVSSVKKRKLVNIYGGHSAGPPHA
jgi:hypothetical protein